MKNEICKSVNLELKAGIYTIIDNDGVYDTVQTKMDMDSIYGVNMEDQNLLSNASQINEISFPLNNATNETSYVLSVNGTKDTIHFFYEKKVHFISVKCGVYYTYSISEIEHSNHLLQNIIITNSEIDVLSAENIQLVL